MAPCRIRAATAADVAEIVRVTNAAYVVEAFCIQGDRTDAEDIAAHMTRGVFLVAEALEEPGHLLGSVHFAEPRPRRAYLGLLAVDPAAQGGGLARKLVEAVEAAARARGCAFLDLTVVHLRTELFPFYTRLGFAPYGTEPFPRGAKLLQPSHLVRMTKTLVAPEALPESV